MTPHLPLHCRIALGIAALAFAACGTAPVADPGDGIPVTVTLTEFGIAMSTTTFAPGTAYTLTVTNAGSAPHEFVIGPPGAEANGHGNGHDNGHGGTDTVLAIAERELPPGATVTRTITLTADGATEAACHLPGHYEGGMVQPLTIT